jgi:uncharacterized membrane protein YphA (DoxX/SURF4 family)
VRIPIYRDSAVDVRRYSGGCAQRAIRTRSDHLQRLFSTFPGGWPGLGLLLLRIAAGSAAVAEGAAFLVDRSGAVVFSLAAGFIGGASGMALLLGLFTPAAGVLAAGGCVCLLLSILPSPSWDVLGDRVAASMMLAVSAAIVLLGPGALSIDSYLFGRREIVIPSDTPR